MASDPRVHAGGGGARGQNLVHPKKLGFLCLSFVEVYILANTYQKAFILGPFEPGRVSFHSMTSDSRVCTGDGARGQNLVHLQKVVLLY